MVCLRVILAVGKTGIVKKGDLDPSLQKQC